MRWEKLKDILKSRQPGLKEICKEMDILYLEKNMAIALILLARGDIHHDDLNSMEDHK